MLAFEVGRWDPILSMGKEMLKGMVVDARF